VDDAFGRAKIHECHQQHLMQTRTSPMNTYAADGYWLEYQPFYPEPLRSSPETAPNEEWWAWRGHTIHVDRLMPEKARGPRIILIHGGGGNGRMLLPAARFLADAGFEVVAPDLPGFGMTVVDPDEIVTYRVWLECLLDFAAREARDGRSLVAFGMSIGGISAYNLASTSPHVVGAIATMLNDPRRDDVRRAFARTPSTVGVSNAFLEATKSFTDAIRLPMSWFSDLGAIANDPQLVRVIEDDPAVGGARMPLGFLRTLINEPFLVEPEDYDGGPVLVVHPDADRWTPTELSARFAERISGDAKLVRLENCGHFPLEEPGVWQMRDAILDWLEQFSGPFPERRESASGEKNSLEPTEDSSQRSKRKSTTALGIVGSAMVFLALSFVASLGVASPGSLPKGSWSYAGGEAEIEQMESSVERVVEEVSFAIRPFVRSALREEGQPYEKLSIGADGPDITVRTEWGAITSPLGETVWREFDGTRVKVTRDVENGVLVDTVSNDDGVRRNTYRLDGDKLIVTSTIRADLLPEPVIFRYTYR
jgi:pimeloyl-ACP methyl ester carboxylesterase